MQPGTVKLQLPVGGCVSADGVEISPGPTRMAQITNASTRTIFKLAKGILPPTAQVSQYP